MPMISPLKFIAAACIGMTSLEASAFEDAKFLAGAACMPMDGQWARVSPNAGWMRNVADTDTYVTCALMADGQDATPVRALSVVVRTGPAPGVIACTAYSGDASTPSFAYSRYLPGEAPSTDYLLEWGVDEIQRNQDAPVGLNCKLPAGAEIRTIALREHDGTDGVP